MLAVVALGGQWITATHCNALQHTATHCNTLQDTATQHGEFVCCGGPWKSMSYCKQLQHTATRCSTLQHAAAHCIATRCNTLQHTETYNYAHTLSLSHTPVFSKYPKMSQRVAEVASAVLFFNFCVYVR